jgi:beta-lactamase class A
VRLARYLPIFAVVAAATLRPAGSRAERLRSVPGPDVQAAAAAAAEARASLDRLIAPTGADVAVVWQPLDRPHDRREEILRNPRVRFHAASTMKVPIMIELFRRVAAGDLRLDDVMTVTNRFHSIVDGSPYELAATEDSDGETYKAIGKPMTLRALCEAMITVSSNLAADNLVEKLGAKSIQGTVNRLGSSGMQVLRGVEDQKAFDQGLNNTTDAMGLATLLGKLGRGEVVSREASAAMVEILKRQTFNDAIPAGLLPGTAVAHKTGNITKIHHDAAIVYADRPYVLVVLVRGIEDEKVSASLIAGISRRLYDYARQPGSR